MNDIKRKKCEISISKKFPDDTWVSIRVGTEIERDHDLGELGDVVFNETMDDLKDKAKKNSIVRSCLKTLKKQIKNAEKVEQALKE